MFTANRSRADNARLNQRGVAERHPWGRPQSGCRYVRMVVQYVLQIVGDGPAFDVTRGGHHVPYAWVS